MNKIRKILRWVWLSKERMVLAVMVCFLCYRVYRVVNPVPDEVSDGLYPPPGSTVPNDVETPGTPPPVPPLPLIDPLIERELVRRDPFVWVSPGERGSSVGGDDIDISLKVLRIQEPSPGRFRAQIQTASTKKWFSEGDPFETYVLESIDPDAGCCVIYAESLEKRIERCIEE